MLLLIGMTFFAIVWTYLLPDVRLARLKLCLRNIEDKLLEFEPASEAEEELQEIMRKAIGGMISQRSTQIFTSHLLFMILASGRYPGIDFTSTAQRVHVLQGLCGHALNSIRFEYEMAMFKYYRSENILFFFMTIPTSVQLLIQQIRHATQVSIDGRIGARMIYQASLAPS